MRNSSKGFVPRYNKGKDDTDIGDLIQYGLLGFFGYNLLKGFRKNGTTGNPQVDAQIQDKINEAQSNGGYTTQRIENKVFPNGETTAEGFHDYTSTPGQVSGPTAGYGADMNPIKPDAQRLRDAQIAGTPTRGGQLNVFSGNQRVPLTGQLGYNNQQYPTQQPAQQPYGPQNRFTYTNGAWQDNSRPQLSPDPSDSSSSSQPPARPQVSPSSSISQPPLDGPDSSEGYNNETSSDGLIQPRGPRIIGPRPTYNGTLNQQGPPAGPVPEFSADSFSSSVIPPARINPQGLGRPDVLSPITTPNVSQLQSSYSVSPSPMRVPQLANSNDFDDDMFTSQNTPLNSARFSRPGINIEPPSSSAPHIPVGPPQSSSSFGPISAPNSNSSASGTAQPTPQPTPIFNAPRSSYSDSLSSPRTPVRAPKGFGAGKNVAPGHTKLISGNSSSGYTASGSSSAAGKIVQQPIVGADLNSYSSSSQPAPSPQPRPNPVLPSQSSSSPQPIPGLGGSFSSSSGKMPMRTPPPKGNLGSFSEISSSVGGGGGATIPLNFNTSSDSASFRGNRNLLANLPDHDPGRSDPVNPLSLGQQYTPAGPNLSSSSSSSSYGPFRLPNLSSSSSSFQRPTQRQLPQPTPQPTPQPMVQPIPQPTPQPINPLAYGGYVPRYGDGGDGLKIGLGIGGAALGLGALGAGAYASGLRYAPESVNAKYLATINNNADVLTPTGAGSNYATKYVAPRIPGADVNGRPTNWDRPIPNTDVVRYADTRQPVIHGDPNRQFSSGMYFKRGSLLDKFDNWNTNRKVTNAINNPLHPNPTTDAQQIANANHVDAQAAGQQSRQMREHLINQNDILQNEIGNIYGRDWRGNNIGTGTGYPVNRPSTRVNAGVDASPMSDDSSYASSSSYLSPTSAPNSGLSSSASLSPAHAPLPDSNWGDSNPGSSSIGRLGRQFNIPVVDNFSSSSSPNNSQRLNSVNLGSSDSGYGSPPPIQPRPDFSEFSSTGSETDLVAPGVGRPNRRAYGGYVPRYEDGGYEDGGFYGGNRIGSIYHKKYFESLRNGTPYMRSINRGMNVPSYSNGTSTDDIKTWGVGGGVVGGIAGGVIGSKVGSPIAGTALGAAGGAAAGAGAKMYMSYKDNN